MNSPYTAMVFGRRALIANSAVLLITIVHHSYGAVRFATPWRHHVTFVALLLVVLLSGAYFIFSRRPASRLGDIARGVFIGAALLGPITWIGIFEGGYNHLLKVGLFHFALSAAAVQGYYPPEIYEPPEDWFFEATGVAQLVFALWALGCVIKFVHVTHDNGNLTERR